MSRLCLFTIDLQFCHVCIRIANMYKRLHTNLRSTSKTGERVYNTYKVNTINSARRPNWFRTHKRVTNVYKVYYTYIGTDNALCFRSDEVRWCLLVARMLTNRRKSLRTLGIVGLTKIEKKIRKKKLWWLMLRFRWTMKNYYTIFRFVI